MNVNLTPELEKLVHEKVNSGFYNSASEVVREALRLMKDRDALQQIRMEELRREVRAGLSQADRGELSSLDVAYIKAEGKKRLGSRRKGK